MDGLLLEPERRPTETSSNGHHTPGLIKDRIQKTQSSDTTVHDARHRLLAAADALSQNKELDPAALSVIVQAADRILEATKDSLENALGSKFEKSSPANGVGRDGLSTKDLLLETESLAVKLSELTTGYQTRVVELKHLHDVHRLRSERAAQRIMQLETEMEELEADMEAERAEFTNLKLQLKIIEVRAQSHMPVDANDEQLTLGIQRWKLEWADSLRRSKARRRKRQELREALQRSLDETMDMDSAMLNGSSSGVGKFLTQ